MDWLDRHDAALTALAWLFLIFVAVYVTAHVGAAVI